LKDFLFFEGFSRRTAMLETVESLRHHAATHDGQLPATLADLEYAAGQVRVAGTDRGIGGTAAAATARSA
jgi:hypothetical protein